MNYEIIEFFKHFNKFQNTLKKTETIAVALPGYGDENMILLSGLSTPSPNTICFHGLIKGKRAEVIQHISSLNVMLCVVSSTDLTDVKRIETPPIR